MQYCNYSFYRIPLRTFEIWLPSLSGKGWGWGFSFPPCGKALEGAFYSISYPNPPKVRSLSRQSLFTFTNN